MDRVFILGLLLSLGTAVAQTTEPPLTRTPGPEKTPGPETTAAAQSSAANADSSSGKLPDSPGVVARRQADVVSVGEASLKASGKKPGACSPRHALWMITYDPNKVDQPPPPCSELVYPYQRFLDTNVIIPLTRKQKGYLALHNATDPATLGTIIGISAISIAADSHTAYGPGLEGFGGLAGVSMLQNTTGEFFGTFAIPALTHQDPRYYRMPHAPFPKRLIYSLTRSYISRSDSGKTIPNYGVLGGYLVAAEISNLYVPGIESDGASTAERIVTGLALDPVNNVINEFLPDVAKHVHVRIIFVQQILNKIAANQGSL
ncbi:hypothetical protein [Edaphobacter aggregans]|uniref:hypothetical protein n=1 Tax=Edaphobacter aggregans TaxID=570835 RepID=UPI00068E476A|nr:hypothetical protein [Edaphobacter aggregans]